MKTKLRILAETVADIALMALVFLAVFPKGSVSELPAGTTPAATIRERVLASVITRVEPFLAAPKPLPSEPVSVWMIAMGFAFATLCFVLAFRPWCWFASVKNKEVSQ